jgi:predicted GNAT family N-acyltransferase
MGWGLEGEMTQDEAINALKKMQENRDQESAHIIADEILCEFLSSLGYDAVVNEYELIHKWYA